MNNNCPYAANGCGGCSGIMLCYEDTVRRKEKEFRQLFPEALPMIAAESPLHYRNKVIRTFYGKKKELHAGIYRAGSHFVIPVHDCLLENRGADRITGTATELLAETGLSAYDEDTGKGLLRHIMIRRAHKTGETLVTVVTGHEQFPGGREFAEKLMRKCTDVKGVIQNINERGDSAVLGFREKILGGKDEIRDEMCGLKVQLKYRSFYQVNTAQAEIVYKTAVDAAGLSGKENVLDAYCGVGLIGMLAAGKAGRVDGIEIVKPAVICAGKSAVENGIKNIRFICGDAAKALAEDKGNYHTVFADPPRAGLSPLFLKSLIQSEPEKIVYISCNPETLHRDLKELNQGGYRTETVQPVDMFPYTEHVETVALLSKGEIDSKRIRVEFPLDNMDIAAFREKATYPQIKNYVLENTGLKVSSLYISQIKRKCGLDVSDSYNKPKSEDSRVPQCPPEKEEAIIDALKHFGMIS